MRGIPIAFDSARKLEWLETNGLGGFASSTVLGMNTRRYHGLLVTATQPPVGRAVLLSKLDEILLVGGERLELGVNQYPGALHPRGDRYLTGFHRDPFLSFRYTAGSVEIEKLVFLVHGENTVVVEYQQLSGAPCTLEVRPFLAFRDYHSTTHRNDALNAALETAPGLVSVQPYAALPRFYFAHNAADLTGTNEWYNNFEYEIERERGLDFQEDLFLPFVLSFTLAPGKSAIVIASTEPRKAADDTMIALPGLTLATGRYNDARNILRAFATSLDQGMLPNRFPDAGQAPEYNTVDATLWFFEAARAYLAYTGDSAFIQGELLPVFRDIIDWHLRGTRYGIHCDADGLLACGEPGVQLTWMDAKIGDWVVTPRTGKPVEVQALWYNALCIMADLTNESRYADLAQKARGSFAQFWDADAGCLYDVVTANGHDGSLRPNQIFAVSLHHALVEGERARQIVDTVERELFTPLGLRTLSPQDPRYRCHYEGGVHSRDSSYHQGTVWPWLLGPFITAYCKVYPGSRQRAALWLADFARHLDDACLGQVSEIADADSPHTSRGCFAQAWSVGEVLRAAVEDVHHVKPLPAAASAAHASPK